MSNEATKRQATEALQALRACEATLNEIAKRATVEVAYTNGVALIYLDNAIIEFETLLIDD